MCTLAMVSRGLSSGLKEAFRRSASGSVRRAMAGCMGAGAAECPFSQAFAQVSETAKFSGGSAVPEVLAGKALARTLSAGDPRGGGRSRQLFHAFGLASLKFLGEANRWNCT